MRLSDLILELRVALDSMSSNPGKWTEVQLVMALNSKQRAMVRVMAERDERFFNHTFVLLKTAARAQHAAIFTWRLPSWMLKPTAIRPYYGATAARGEPIRRAQKNGSRGFELSAANELKLLGYSAAIDLEIECAKIPARMTKGTLNASQAGLTTAQIRLEDDPTGATALPRDAVLDAYAGALFELTGSSARTGQLLRCIGSTAGTTGRVMTMEEAWGTAPVAADPYEMHMEVPMQHSRLLVLLAARLLLAQEKNVDGIAAYRDEVNEEWKLFLDTMSNRDLTEPHTVVEALPTSDAYPETAYQGEYL